MLLTVKQEKVLRYVANSVEDRNGNPGIRAIAVGIGSSSMNRMHCLAQTSLNPTKTATSEHCPAESIIHVA